MTGMELLERGACLAEMERALSETGQGSGRMVLISGEAGIGKTALVERFVAAHRDELPLFWGACDALFAPRPLGPLLDMAPEFGGSLVERLAADTPRTTIFSMALAELQRRRVMVVVEDVHWADEATLDFLRFVGRRLHLTAALLIVTYRDDELEPRHPLRRVLGDLASSTKIERISLPHLSEGAVRRLIGSAAVDPVALHRQTNGNPFYVTEVLANPEGTIPPSIRDAVLARVGRLSPSGFAVLEAAAVIGSRVESWLLAAVAGAEAPHVEESVAAGMLHSHDNLLAFRHELARQTILDLLSPLRRQVLHRLALDGLVAAPLAEKNLSRLAHHAEGSADPDAIMAYGRAAANEAMATGNYRAAGAHLAPVLRCADGLPLEEQIELQEAYAISMQGNPGRMETMAAYRRAADLARQANLPEKEGFYKVRLSSVLDSIGQGEAGWELLMEALAVLEPLAPNRGLIDGYRLLAMHKLSDGDVEGAVDYAEKSYQMAVETETKRVVIGAYQIMGLCWLPLDHKKGCEYIEDCLALALENDEYWAAAALFPNLAMTLVDVFKLDRAQELIADGLRYTIDHDQDLATYLLEAWQAMAWLYQGQYDQCRALTDGLLARSGLQPGTRNTALTARGRLLVRQGELTAGQELIEEALTQTRRLGNRQRMGVYFCAAAEAAWLAGDRPRLDSLIDDFYDIAMQNRQPGFAAELAYWRWCAGEKIEPQTWMVEPFALQIKGEWQAAAAAWEALGCPYEQARALAEGDIEAQIEALIMFEGLGARPMVERVRHQLRQADVRTIPRGPRSTTRENPYGLTNRQVDILTLLLEDLTNTEIAARLHLSPKTVGHHVSAVLMMLEVSNRQEAAAKARQHPLFAS